MTRTNGILVAALTLLAAAGCGSHPGPAPSTVSNPGELAVFLDRDSGFTTYDVYDAQDQPMRFNAAGDLIWMASGERFGGFIADGQVITAGRVCAACYFLVRFGSEKGERRAYLTWAGAGAADEHPPVLDVEIDGAHLSVTTSEKPLPND
jgi:hypothetical protein